MAQEPDQIRQAIEETRQELGETIQALGEKADLKGQVNEKVSAGREQLKATTEAAQKTLADLGERAGQAIPDGVRPVVTETAGQARQAANRAVSGARQRPVPVILAIVAVLLLLTVRRRVRRWRRSP